MIVKHQIKLDFIKKGDSPCVHAVQGDSNTRMLEISLCKNDAAWALPEGTSALLRFCKPDGTGGLYDTLPDGTQAWSIDSNVVCFTLAPQVLAVPGLVRAQLELVKGDATLGSFVFHIFVERDPSEGIAASGDYFNWNAWAETALGKKMQQARESGEFDGYTPVKGKDYWTDTDKEEMIAELEASFDIPDYWQEHVNGKIAAIRALQDAGGRNAVSFVVLTDMHYYANLGKCSPLLARYIMDKCNIKYALVLGDTQNRGSWTTKALAEAEFADVDEMLAPIADRMLRTQGNHDGSWGATLNGLAYPYNFTPEEMYNRIYRKSQMLDGIHTDDTGTGYYVDDCAGKFRYIVLNTHCNEYAVNEDGSALYNNRTVFRFTQSQYDMVVDALTNMPDGYHVAVFAHVPICNTYADLFGGSDGDHVVMRKLLTAYKNKTSYAGSFSGTAGGEISAAYTNRSGTITENVRLSSSGVTKDSTGAVVTDYIACKQGDVLRVMGIDIKSSPLPDGTNSPSICMYDSDKTTLGVIYTGSTVADAITTDTDGSAMYLLAVDRNGSQLTGSDNMAYIRICGTPTGEDIVVTLNEQIVETSGEVGYDTVSVDADFTNARGEFVGYFSGHMHTDQVYANKDWGIDIITTRCDAQEENDSALSAERVAGTTTEQSFDVFTVNTAKRRIYATKIGAGSDREISY